MASELIFVGLRVAGCAAVLVGLLAGVVLPVVLEGLGDAIEGVVR